MMTLTGFSNYFLHTKDMISDSFDENIATKNDKKRSIVQCVNMY